MDRPMRALLESEALERMKGLHQLGFAHLVFRNARHSRYDHALGTCHLTRLVLRRIVDSGAYLEERDLRSALAAALLLHAGSPPYGDALEGLGLPPRRELSRRWIEESDAARVLQKEWELDPHNVLRLVLPEEDRPVALTPTEHLLRDILSGSLDADSLDGLARDARAAEAGFLPFKIEPLLEHLRVVGQENRAVLSVDEEGAGALQALVFSRYLMHYNVYGHHALRAPTVMFRRAAQDALQGGAVAPEKLAALDDARAFSLVRESAREGSPAAAVLTRLLSERRLYRRAIELDERHPGYGSLLRLREDANWRRRVEEAWARYLTRYRKGEAGPFDILIDIPPRSRPSVGLRFIRRLPVVPGERSLTTWQSLSGLSGEDMRRCWLPLHRIRVFAAGEELARSVRRHAEELFTIAEEV
ncbi:hypothetical protein [Rubrobacter xylanophilus]|uniref:hypothetical protein n=1 Tax=Rubrobacter xylanophilus TaxID=49319 RepID=UPI00030087BA|nr:hypothetical protein [Rubrobacter xylanophilus]